VDLDGVLGAMAGAMGFSCQGPLGALAGLLIARGRLRPGLDLLGARILDQRSGLDRCHPTPLTPPPPHSSVSQRLLSYIATAGRMVPAAYMGGTALHCTALYSTAQHCTALHCTALHSTVQPPSSSSSKSR